MYCLDIFYKKFRGPIGLQVSDAKLLLCSIINWFEAETLCFYLWIASYILELLVGKPWWICLEEDDRLCFWAGIELLDAQLCFER